MYCKRRVFTQLFSLLYCVFTHNKLNRRGVTRTKIKEGSYFHLSFQLYKKIMGECRIICFLCFFHRNKQSNGELMSHHVFNKRLLHLADGDGFWIYAASSFYGDFYSFLRLRFANFRIFSLLYTRRQWMEYKREKKKKIGDCWDTARDFPSFDWPRIQ